MSEEYARDILRRNVAQICQTIGLTGINSTPLDILVHVLEKYILTLGTQAGRYAEQLNRTEPNLHDLGLVFRDMNIQLPELAEYTRSVPPIPQPLCAPIFPKPKDCNLNFLKPGSHEAVTRPMHVHAHLPPMYPEKEQDTPLVANTIEICTSPEISGTDGTDPFKRPCDFTTNLQDVKRPIIRLDDEGTTRKISSVMMTMSGLLLPAREGKLPSAWPPIGMSEKHDKYICNSQHSSASKVPTLEERSDKKSMENKTLNGKVMKSKNKDKGHKSDGSTHKDSKLSKAVANTPGHLIKSKGGHNRYNQLSMPLSKASTTQKTSMPPTPVPLDIARPAIPQPLCAPIFPKPKDCNLNFLKPGSHEAVTRPMHVHEYLPPMYPEKEQETLLVANIIGNCTRPEISGTGGTDKPKDPFKSPYDFTTILQDVERPRLRLDDEERTRKISSVMMTMTGLLLPAREGKLPEVGPPMVMSEKHDKYICHSHHFSASKVPALEERSDKKSKKNKTLDGKVMKSKNNDKSKKSDGSKHKDSKLSKAVANTPGHFSKSKEGRNLYNHSPMPLPKVSTTQKTSMPPPPAPLDIARPAVKQEPLDIQQPLTSATTSKNLVPPESEIPVPRKIPISKSPVPNPVPRNKHQPATVTHISEIKIKKEVIDEEEKLASQPDRSKLSIFKKISNKSKDENSSADTFSEKPQSTVGLNKVRDHTIDNIPVTTNDNVRIKSEETPANNNNCKVLEMSKEIDLRAHEVINIDDDSLETFKNKTNLSPNVSVNKSLQLPYPKDVAGVIPETKKEKRHKVKKEKAANLEGMTTKKKPDLFDMHQMPIPKMSRKSSKSSKPKNESKMLQMPPGFPFFPAMPASNRNMMSGPGLIPIPGLMIPGSDILAGLTNNPALRGLSSSANLLPSPFALSASGPGLIPAQNILPGSRLTNPSMQIGNYPNTSRSSSIKLRPSLEVIPVENDLEPPVPEPTPQLKPVAPPRPTKPPADVPQETRKKDESHKKDKKDKDGVKIKKKKDKKDKNEDKSEKKRIKEERQELKQKIKKEQKEENKKKLAEGLVPKLTLKLSSSNSNSPMPPSSPDVFKLNIKPVVKKEDESPSIKEETVIREHCRSPELAQISALVTRPPKQKHSSKHNHVRKPEAQTSSPPSSSSPAFKSRPPSSQSKYKRRFKPLSKKGDFDEETASRSKEPTPPPPSDSVDKPLPPLSTPYYVDEYGIKIWVCPACSRQDDGSPMIGCDGCDSWYHWVCVGISEEPGLAEDWFCKACAKRTAMAFAEVSSGKKRDRKPKTKVQRL